MADYLIKDTTLQGIADSIRNKTGNTESIQVADMANEIDNYNPELQDKTITPTASKQTITADNGYYGLDTVTVNAMPTATQATPNISVNSSGLITASATQSAGYVAAGTKTNTKQLTTQAAQTITPGTSNKTIASGRYLTGTQTIKGDSNLVAGNIKNGVSIFGVTGTHSGGENLDAVIAEQAELISELESVLDSKASGSGGGASVETCTVTITSSTNTELNQYMFTCYNSDSVSVVYPDGTTRLPLVIQDVICNSGCYLQTNATIPGYAVTNGTLNWIANTLGQLLAEPGAEVVIDARDND